MSESSQLACIAVSKPVHITDASATKKSVYFFGGVCRIPARGEVYFSHRFSAEHYDWSNVPFHSWTTKSWTHQMLTTKNIQDVETFAKGSHLACDFFAMYRVASPAPVHIGDATKRLKIQLRRQCVVGMTFIFVMQPFLFPAATWIGTMWCRLAPLAVSFTCR